MRAPKTCGFGDRNDAPQDSSQMILVTIPRFKLVIYQKPQSASEFTAKSLLGHCYNLTVRSYEITLTVRCTN